MGIVSAVLLAAGISSRMGQLKQLLPLNNRPVIRHCLDSVIAAGIEDIVVVLRPEREDLIKTTGLSNGIKIVFNKKPFSDMAESARAGIKAVNDSSTGILICLSDHPLVSPTTIEALLNSHAEFPDKIIIPRYDLRNGHPCLFPKEIAREIFSAMTLREIITAEKKRVEFIEVSDEGVVLDMDTMEDYREIIEKTGIR